MGTETQIIGHNDIWRIVAILGNELGTYTRGAVPSGFSSPMGVTKAVWEAFKPEWHQRLGDLTPQPTWDVVWARYQKFILEQTHSLYDLRGTSYAFTRRAVTDIGHSRAGAPVYLGGGIDHVTSIVHLLSESRNAGKSWPLAIFRDHDGGFLHLWSDREGAELISAASRQNSRLESAKNLFVVEAERLIAIVNDKNGGLKTRATAAEKRAARLAAFEKIRVMRDDPEPLIDKLLADVDKMAEELPEDDLPRLKHVLIGLLESTATAKLEELTGAESQHGIDLHPACQSEGDAMTDVSEAKKIAQIRIERADTVEKAKAAAKKGEEAINAVSALRTPIFERLLTGAATEAINTAAVTFEEKAVTIRARHPNWRESRHRIPGEVSLFGHPETGEDGTIPAGVYGVYTAPETPSELGEMDVALTVPAGTKATFKLTGRSVCGPSYLAVTLDAPAEAPAE